MEHLAKNTAAVVPADESTVANELEPAASVEADDAIAPLEPTPAAVDVMTETEEETALRRPLEARRRPWRRVVLHHPVAVLLICATRPSDADSALFQRW